MSVLSGGLWLALTALGSYLMGAFPTAYLIGKLNGIDIFASGSGNMGANNTYHTLGFAWGALVWLIDVSKGVLVTVLARLLAPTGLLTASATIGGFFAVFGHNWSIWVLLLTGQWRGGKGAATAGGTWLINTPLPVFAATLGLWGMLAGLTGYVALATLVTFAVGSLWMTSLAVFGQVPSLELIYVLGVAGLIYWRHRENIRALWADRERRMKNIKLQGLMAISGLIVLVLALGRL